MPCHLREHNCAYGHWSLLQVRERFKNARAVDYNAEVPFELKPRAGFYATEEEEQITRNMQQVGPMWGGEEGVFNEDRVHEWLYEGLRSRCCRSWVHTKASCSTLLVMSMLRRRAMHERQRQQGVAWVRRLGSIKQRPGPSNVLHQRSDRNLSTRTNLALDPRATTCHLANPVCRPLPVRGAGVPSGDG